MATYVKKVQKECVSYEYKICCDTLDTFQTNDVTYEIYKPLVDQLCIDVENAHSIEKLDNVLKDILIHQSTLTELKRLENLPLWKFIRSL